MTYTFGGTVQAGGGVYIPRRADDELLKLCQDAIFSYVLTPRQMGKSSLMVRTAQTLVAEGIQAVIVDLQELGAQVTAEQWYFGFLVKLDDQLMFETDVISWWQQHQHLGVSQRLTLFFEKVLLAEVTQKVVIFVDEIDSTLSLDFTDDFFTAVRYLYVARATNPEFHRLSFVLMGVATPGDLIRDAKRTPFNIGQRVDLTDFTFEEALPLAHGLGLPDNEALQMLRWVLEWTGGHPYLTQRLCGAVVKRLGEGNVVASGSSPHQSLQVSLTEKELDKIVSSSFFGVMSQQDNNLQFVRDMLTKRAPQGLEKEVLSVYRHIHRGKRQVVDEEQSLVKSHLKLSGVVRRHGNTLVVRNGIYRHVFDQHWIREHLPENLWQRLKPALPLIATLSVFSILMAVLAQYAFDRTREAQKQTHEAQKQKANAQLFAQSLTSENFLISGGNDIEALIEGLKAVQKLNKLGKDAEEDIRMRVLANLQQVVYGVHERNRLEGHSRPVTSVAFSPDGKTIASASYDNTVKLWNLSGQPLQTLKGHSRPVTSVAFSPDGKTIASASYDNTVKLWNLSGQPLQTLKGHSRPVTSVAFSPDGKTIASASSDNTVKLWNLSGQPLQTLKGHSRPVTSVAFSPDGKTIATASSDNTVKLWNLSGQPLQTLKGHSGEVSSVAFSPDGKTIASASYDNTVKLWNLSGQPLQTLKGHSGEVSSVAFSPDGKTIASASYDNTVKLWNLSGQPLQTLKGHSGEVSSVAFSPDGKTIASASYDNTVKLWNLSGQPLQTLKGHSGEVSSVAFSPDGKTIASASYDNTVKLWNLSGQPLQTLKGHSGEVSSVAFSPDGKTIASASYDNTVKLWNLSGQPLQTLKGHSGEVSSVAFSPDGKTIASASSDNTVKLWNLSGQPLQTLKGHSRPVTSVAFSPDGKTIASASYDNTVKLWNLSGQPLQTLKGHSRPVTSVAFSPDGKTIASASYDNTVKLWNLSGQPLQTLEGHSGPVFSVAFSPDGKTIASASYDNTVKLWNFNLENLRFLGCGWLQGYLISHPETLEELEQCQNQNKSLLIVAADSLVTEGEKLAQDGNFEGAVAKFKKANAWKPKLGINPEVKAAPAYVTQAKEKAKDGDLAGTIAKLKQAQQVDPKVNLDPDTQAVSPYGEVKSQKSKVKNNPEVVAKKLVAPAFVRQGEELAKQGDFKKGIEKYTVAQKLDSTLKISAESWLSICFGGSLHNQAADVMFACEKAVALASKKEEASAKVWRGLAKALAGDKQGAIADFEVYIQSKDISAEDKKQVQGWVDALHVGKDPFTAEVLKKLRGE